MICRCAADPWSVQCPVLAATFALLAGAQPLQELAAARQRESVQWQLASVARQSAIRNAADRAAAASVQTLGSVAERQQQSSSGKTPPGTAPEREGVSSILSPSQPPQDVESALAQQRASVERQLASLASQHGQASPWLPAAGLAPAREPPPMDHPSPVRQSAEAQASLVPQSSSIVLQLQAASLQPRLAWPEPPDPAAVLDCAPVPAMILEPLFARAAAANGLDPSLLRAVARRESAFRPCAMSSAGAMGLMQLMPETASTLGVDDPFDPEQSIFGGARFLRSLLDRFDNNLGLALAAYSAGPARVDRLGAIPPIPETQSYVTAILRALSHPPPD